MEETTILNSEQHREKHETFKMLSNRTDDRHTHLETRSDRHTRIEQFDMGIDGWLNVTMTS